MDLVDLNLIWVELKQMEKRVEILVDLVDLNLNFIKTWNFYRSRDPCGSRGSKYFTPL